MLRNDPKVLRRARACPAMEYAESVVVSGALDLTSRHNVTVILLPMSLKQHEQVTCVILLSPFL